MTEMPFVAVAVAAAPVPDAENLRAALARHAASAGVETGPGRTLGPGAVELGLALPAGGPTARDLALQLSHALSETLADRASHGVDVAVLPSKRRMKRLLICDMDSTIIGQECLDELADFAGLKAEVAAITERAMRGELDFEGALTTRVAMLKGLAIETLTRCYEERITLNPGARTLVATMRSHGAQTLLVSGGFTFFTARVASAAGFQSHQGNTLVDDGAHLTGEVGTPILGRGAKRDALDHAAARAGLAPADALAIGDGANDLAMIQAAGLGLAYYAKPVVAGEAHAAIAHTDLTTALYYQGYTADAFIVPDGD